MRFCALSVALYWEYHFDFPISSFGGTVVLGLFVLVAPSPLQGLFPKGSFLVEFGRV